MSKLLLLGAGHAHMTLMAHIEHIIKLGHEVTVVGPGPRHYYSGMGPGMLGGDYTPHDISFPVHRMCEQRGAKFIEAKCIRINPEGNTVTLSTGEEVAYDVASFNTGSSIVDDVVAEGSEQVYRVKPIENLQQGRERIQTLARDATRSGPICIGVIGGGPAGLEVATNAHAAAVAADADVLVRIYAGKRFMRGTSEKIRTLARKTLADRQIELVEQSYVTAVTTGSVTLEDGTQFTEDIIFVAMGVKPRPLFGPSGVPSGPDGGLLVNKYLQSTRYPNIFGGGDCIYFEPQPLDKVGVYAVRENPILYHNVLACLQNEPLVPFNPGDTDYLLIFNTGLKTGILQKKRLLFGGKPAFWVKDYIDTKFMHEFKPDYER